MERKNMIFLERVRFIMAHVNLPISYWGDTFLTVAYILNRVLSKSVIFTPCELWTGCMSRPNLRVRHVTTAVCH